MEFDIGNVNRAGVKNKISALFHIFDFLIKIDIIKKIKLRGNNNGIFIWINIHSSRYG